MTSTKQIEANRRNALASTGPRTQEGKAIVARNAVKHGLTAQSVLLPDEHEATIAWMCSWVTASSVSPATSARAR
jgi:hypothetical protein